MGASILSLTRDMTLYLYSSQSEGDLKHFKNLQSPFSKIAKGVPNIKASLDPRKIAAKGGAILSSTTSPSSTQPEAPHKDYAGIYVLVGNMLIHLLFDGCCKYWIAVCKRIYMHVGKMLCLCVRLFLWCHQRGVILLFRGVTIRGVFS